jgi:RNA polymerase sigma-70 factor (ECF subfamily)
VPDLDDRYWLERIRAGDLASFETVFRRLAPALCVFVMRYVESRDAAEDLVQDLFLTLWARRESLEVRTSLSTYLHTAARNRALNHLKHERVAARWRSRSRAEIEDSYESIESTLFDQELSIAVRDAIESLPERTRLVFTMSRQRGLTYNQIAAELGLSVKTVETQMGRALRMMRARLHDLRS